MGLLTFPNLKYINGVPLLANAGGLLKTGTDLNFKLLPMGEVKTPHVPNPIQPNKLLF